MADRSASACRMSGSVQGWGMSDSMTSAILVGAVPWRGEGAGNGLPKRIFRTFARH